MIALESTHARPYDQERDWWAVRDLLIDSFPLAPPGFNWDVRRWDGQRFHRADLTHNSHWNDLACVWETGSGRLVGIAHPENNKAEVHIQLDPDYRFLLDEMLAWAERCFGNQGPEPGQRQVTTYAHDHDATRQAILRARGYRQETSFGVLRRLRFGSATVPSPVVPEGYQIRTTRPRNDADCKQIAQLLNAAFHRTIHSAVEYLNFTTHSPSYRHDLDLVIEGPEQSLVALVGVTYEPINRYGVFEPVCTHPDHARQGLARALILEGLRRLISLGADLVHVDTGDRQIANAFYDSLGFTEAYRGHAWSKVVT